MITGTAWVPHGFAAEFPVKYELDESELERISELSRLNLNDANEDLEEAMAGSDDEHAGAESDAESAGDDAAATAGTGAGNRAGPDLSALKNTEDADDDLREYNLDSYDEPTGEQAGVFSNINSLAYYKSNDEDPYIVLPEGERDDLEEEEREELQILHSDSILLVTKTEENMSTMEVYVYEEAESNLYVHHDLMLPAFPLCVEWLNYRVGPTRAKEGDTGNFAAIGTFDPDIEIWNLDVVDGMYPDAILGNTRGESALEAEPVETDKKKKKKKKSKKPAEPVANDKYHVGPVLALAGNRLHKNLLASGSADKTIKLWDLSTLSCARSYTFHTDKVSALNWHPTEGPVLLSGAYDRTIVASDMRAPDTAVRRWGVEADINGVRWDVHDPNFFYVATESGRVHYFDARTAPASLADSKPVWTLQAHDDEVSSFDINPTVPGFLATGSPDREVKLWKVTKGRPSLVASRNLDVGKVYSVAWAPDRDTGLTLAVGGSKSVVQVWDTKTNANVRRALEADLAGLKDVISASTTDKVVGVARDDSEDEFEDADDDEDMDD
ncbi:transducin family protein [Dipodascopsis tothii]|uniref:transducin family protein n=1 Tax=Dipodascopsis tothii TaxID=44089 RepID=UPI0034CF5941